MILFYIIAGIIIFCIMPKLLFKVLFVGFLVWLIPIILLASTVAFMFWYLPQTGY